MTKPLNTTELAMFGLIDADEYVRRTEREAAGSSLFRHWTAARRAAKSKQLNDAHAKRLKEKNT